MKLSFGLCEYFGALPHQRRSQHILSLWRILNEHIKHLEFVFKKLISHGLIVSKKKLKLFKTQIEFLGLELENGQIKLQEHIVKK